MKLLTTLFVALEKKLGVFGIVVASMQGIALPLCMYGTNPIEVSFSKSGIAGGLLIRVFYR